MSPIEVATYISFIGQLVHQEGGSGVKGRDRYFSQLHVSLYYNT